jgi:nitrite reductase/ring-hydroxylating ferredoxin subunit
MVDGVEQSIRSHCPEILHIQQVSKGPAEASGTSGTDTQQAQDTSTIHFVSPFARHAEQGWVDAADLDEIAPGGILERRVRDRSVLLSLHDGSVSCLDNQCAHLGMPLDMGEVHDGVITCTYHGFQYRLSTGECLTAPEVQLVMHAVRVVGTRVQVRLEG